MQMRAVLTAGVMVLALTASALLTAQTRDAAKEDVKKAEEPDKEDKDAPLPPVQRKKPTPAPRLTSRAILSRLQLEIDTEPFREKMKFKEFLKLISEQLQTNDRAVTINVDMEAFGAILGADAPNPFEEEVCIYGSHRKRATVLDMLNEVGKQIGKGAAIVVIRGGRVDIVSWGYSAKEYMLNQTFRADFKDQRLDLALDELSDLTGVSLVIDARAKEKPQATVTARFNDDVALQDAVRMLTAMADLKIVYLPTSMYITTPERAKEMQKELKKIYEPKAPANPFGGMFPGGPLPDPNFNAPSPLAPPLPPVRAPKRLEAAT
jgi:hypothetical protein